MDQSIKTRSGIEKYLKIMHDVSNVDVASDSDFQRSFNGFYRIRRNETFRKIYYTYFEKMKNEQPDFEDILRYLYNETGRLEASFSSKMLASIDIEKPIWDSIVLKYLHVKPASTYLSPETRIIHTVSIYQQICDFYKSSTSAHLMEQFDILFPEYADVVPNIKKADFMIWGTNGSPEVLK